MLGKSFCEKFGCFFFVLALSFSSCHLNDKSPVVKQFGPYRQPVINVDSAMVSIRQMLAKDSVNNILIVKYSCKDCLFRNYYLNEKKNGQMLAVNSTPLYAFWTKGDFSYIKKIDQYGYYVTLVRPAISDFMLFDYYSRNRSEIQSEQVLGSDKDFNEEEIKWFEQNRIDFRQSVFTYYEGAPNGSTYNRMSMENSGLELYYESGKTIFRRYLDLSKFRPMVSADKNAQGMKNKIPYANNTVFYYHNQLLKVNIWVKLIESQLFDIESRSTWLTESKMKL
jgi:hypothetical protein